MISMPPPSTILMQCGKEAPGDGYEAHNVDQGFEMPRRTLSSAL